MAITTIEGYVPLATGPTTAVGGDGSIWRYQPNIAAGMAQLEPAGTVPSPPVNTVLPVVSGTPKNGQTLTTSNGTWLNAPTSYTYVWLRNGLPISGATSQTYVAASADIGTMIVAQVTGVNANGTDVAQSAAIGPVSS